MSDRLKGNIAAFTAMILWATGFPVTVAILQTWNPLLLAPVRLGISALALLGLLFLTGGIRHLRGINWWDVTWIGGGILAASTILLLYGQNLAHPITVAVIISTMPLISAVMGMVGGSERMTLPLAFGIVLSIVGGVVTSYGPSGAAATEGNAITGAVLVFVSITLFVAYTRSVAARFPNLPDVAGAGLTCLAATLVVGDIAFAASGWSIVEMKYDFAPQTLALVAWLGAVSFGAAMALWFTSVRLIGTTITTMHHNIVPFYVILMSLAVGGAIATHHWVGAGLVIVGAIIAQLAPRKRIPNATRLPVEISPPAPVDQWSVSQQDPSAITRSVPSSSQPLGPAHAYARPMGAAVVQPALSVYAAQSATGVPMQREATRSAPPGHFVQQTHTPPPRNRDVETGMLIMACAMLWLPLIDTFAKLVSNHIPAGEVSWARFFFQTLLLAPMALIRVQHWQWSQMPLHFARGTLIAIATLLFFAALKYLPLADAISIFFIEPLILTILSVLFLRETIGWRRLTAIIVGFVGAMIVIRPSYSVFGLPALLPLGTALTFAIYLMLTRRVAQKEDPITIQFLAGVFGLIVMTATLAVGSSLKIPVITPVWPTNAEWLLLAGVGVVATTGHLLVVHAFRRAEAGVLAPFQYLEIIPSVILGFLVFGDFPDALTWAGITIIVGSGIYVFHRERAVARDTALDAWESAPLPARDHRATPELQARPLQSRGLSQHLPRPVE